MSSLEVSSGGSTVIDGALQVCPGTTVCLNCSHESTSDLTRWEIGAAIGCSGVAVHSTIPSNTVCGTFTINMVSAMNQPTRMSTLVLSADQSLNGAVVTCYAGPLTSDPQAGNLTIQVIGEILHLLGTWVNSQYFNRIYSFVSLHAGPPSTPTVDSVEYSVGNSTTGQFRFLVSSSGTFRTEVAISASVVGGSGSVIVTDNSITVTGLSYTESHTVSVVATSAVCPGVDNSTTDVPVVFNIRSEWNISPEKL